MFQSENGESGRMKMRKARNRKRKGEKKKKITRNCTQYSHAWVFLSFVHVVKF